jgi:hypothetical protein
MERKTGKEKELRLSPRAMDLAVWKALQAAQAVETERPKRLGAVAPVMAEIYSTAANACLCGGPTSGQLKAVETLVARIEGLRS